MEIFLTCTSDATRPAQSSKAPRRTFSRPLRRRSRRTRSRTLLRPRNSLRIPPSCRATSRPRLVLTTSSDSWVFSERSARICFAMDSGLLTAFATIAELIRSNGPGKRSPRRTRSSTRLALFSLELERTTSTPPSRPPLSSSTLRSPHTCSRSTSLSLEWRSQKRNG